MRKAPRSSKAFALEFSSMACAQTPIDVASMPWLADFVAAGGRSLPLKLHNKTCQELGYDGTEYSSRTCSKTTSYGSCDLFRPLLDLLDMNIWVSTDMSTLSLFNFSNPQAAITAQVSEEAKPTNALQIPAPTVHWKDSVPSKVSPTAQPTCIQNRAICCPGSSVLCIRGCVGDMLLSAYTLAEAFARWMINQQYPKQPVTIWPRVSFGGCTALGYEESSQQYCHAISVGPLAPFESECVFWFGIPEVVGVSLWFKEKTQPTLV